MLKNFLTASSHGFKRQAALRRPAITNWQPNFGLPLFQARFFGQVQPVPSMGDSISEGVIQSFEKQPGEFVVADEIVAKIETDKVTVDILATHSGQIKKYYNEEGDTVEVGADFLEIDTDAKAAAAPVNAAAEPVKAEPVKQEAAPVAAPVKAAPAPPKAAPAQSGSSMTKNTSKTAPTEISGTRTETRVPMKRIRMTIAKNLKDSQNINASLTTFNEIDMSAYIDAQKAVTAAFEKKHGQKLGFMGVFMKASVQALKEQPIVNAVISDNDIVYRDFIDLSCAVASPAGLLVPVLRNAQNMGFADFQRELTRLALKARDGKITLEEMSGGTFTITNGGVFGSMMGTPIINTPQSAVLGMHATKLRPVVVGGAIVARPIMYVALTYDHRIIDGREAVLFLRKIKECVEDPKNILFDL